MVTHPELSNQRNPSKDHVACESPALGAHLPAGEVHAVCDMRYCGNHAKTNREQESSSLGTLASAIFGN